MVIGIDLGTTNSLVSVWRNGQTELVPNALGTVLTPSVVSVDTDGSILVGLAARERLQSHPERTAASFKRAMGTAKAYQLGPRSFRPEELSALVLRSLKADAEAALGSRVTEAVITVPAYFSDAQRHATRSAGAIAGFTQVILLNEPTAAALAYGLHQKQGETQFLVFDFGGGTFDVSVLEMFDGVMEVRSTAGDNQLGGDDIDTALVRHFIEASGIPAQTASDPHVAAQLLALLEAAKRRLETDDNVPIALTLQQRQYATKLSLAQAEAASETLLKRLRAPVERALRDARIRVNELDAIVLAGGSTRFRVVRQLVTRMFGRFPEAAINPDEVVARGAAVQAGLKMRDAALKDRVMTDVCPYTLGVDTHYQLATGRFVEGLMEPMLERNTIIPASRVKSFLPVNDEQNELRIAVYQGEGRRVADNIKLGELTVRLPFGPKTTVKAEVRFTYDTSGLLEVEATVFKNGGRCGETKRLIIENSAERLSSEEISQKLDALSLLKIHPRDRMATRTLLARAERHHGQLLGSARESLARLIAHFEHALESQDDRIIKAPQNDLEKMLELIDSDRYLSDDLV